MTVIGRIRRGVEYLNSIPILIDDGEIIPRRWAFASTGQQSVDPEQHRPLEPIESGHQEESGVRYQGPEGAQWQGIE